MKKEFNLFKSKIIGFSFLIFSVSIFGTAIISSMCAYQEYQSLKRKNELKNKDIFEGKQWIN